MNIDCLPQYLLPAGQHGLDGFEDWLRDLISDRFGTVQERPFDEGVLDSLNAIELGLELEDAFGIGLADISLADMQSITELAERIRCLVDPVRKAA